MFAYCGNNPVNYVDSAGSIPTPFNYEWRNPSAADKDDAESGIDGTISLGIAGAVTPFLVTVGGQICISTDMSGNTELQWAPIRGVSSGTPGGSLMPFISVTNAPNVEKLRGEAYQSGAVTPTPPAISADFIMFKDSVSSKIYTGISVAMGMGGKDTHILLSDTRTLARMPFNLLIIIDNAYNSLLYGSE